MRARVPVQFQDIRAFQELTGHYDAMTLQGGIGALTVASGGVASDKQKMGFKGAQYFKTVRACCDLHALPPGPAPRSHSPGECAGPRATLMPCRPPQDMAAPKGKRAYVWETGGLAAATNVLPPGAWYCSDVSDAEVLGSPGCGTRGNGAPRGCQSEATDACGTGRRTCARTTPRL